MSKNQFKFKIENNKYYKLGFLNWKEITKSDYINELDKDISNIGRTQNFNLFKYLNDKYEVDFYNGKSTYGEEVSCQFTNWDNNLMETQNGYAGNLSFTILIKSKKNGNPLAQTQFNTFLSLQKKVSKNLLQMLFERAYSGTFENPWLEEDIYNEMKSCGIVNQDAELTFCCETCNQKFNSLNELLAHLIDENHYDNILYLHRNNPEFGNIYKRLLPFKKGEN